MVRFRVLGPLEVSDGDGRPIRLTSRNQQVVLAVLLAQRGLVVPAAALVAALWGDTPPPTALGTLRSYVSRLRGLLGAGLVTRADGWALLTEPGEVDALVFDQGITTSDPDRLAELLSLWRGAAFAGLADLDAVRGEAARLESCRRSVVVQLAEAQLRAGRSVEAVATAEQLTSDEPLDERGWAALIRGLAAVGRAADALRAFQRAAATLAEAGLEPSSWLREAERAALGAPSRSPGQATPPARPSLRSPGAVSTLIGREVELSQLSGLVAEHPLVTVVGPGGVGKTRLAIELAAKLASRHALGARMIELSQIDSHDSLGDAVLDGLGIVRGSGQAADVFERLADVDMLVVLDNCEHVVDEVAALVGRALRPGRATRILATSRERLGLPGEQVWRLEPLDTTEAGAACQLFVDRASAIRLDGRATMPPDLVQHIVARLDGLPLAIEMAAARLDTMTCNELADLLDDRLTDLRSGLRGGDERHRTLVAAIEWSEALLSEEERRVFAGFSVFAGPVDSRDIAPVLGDGALDLVRRLAGRSLVTVDLRGDRARYAMLETVKAYAARLLVTYGLDQGTRARHAQHVLTAAQLADAELNSEREATAHERLDGLFGELRAAHRWARDNDVQLAVELNTALWLWAYMRARDECFVWAEAGLERYPEGEKPPALLAVVATRASYIGRLDEACRLADRVLSGDADTLSRLIALTALSDSLSYQGKLDEALTVTADIVAEATRAGAPRFVSYAHCNAALALIYSGRPDEIGPHLAAMRTSALGETDKAMADYVEGEASLDRDPAAALAAFDRSVRRSDSVGSRFISGVARVSSVSLRARHADANEALEAFVELIEYWRQTGNDVHQLTTLRNVPTLLQRLDAPEACAAVLGGVESQAISPTFGEEADRLRAAHTWARDRLGDARFEAIYGPGASQSFPQAVQSALDHLGRLRTATS